MDETTPRFGQPDWRLGQSGVVIIALVAAAVLFAFSFTAGWGARGFAQHAFRPRYAMAQAGFSRAAAPGPMWQERSIQRQPEGYGDQFGPGAGAGCPSWQQRGGFQPDERGFQRGPGW